METIEHIIQQPVKRRHQTPLLFQHGAWHGAWCWRQWMGYFASLGYEAHAISLPAHGNSSGNKRQINLYTLKDYVETLVAQVKLISPRPVVIGHSLGGGIVQKYLENHQLPGAVLLASLPSTGMLPMLLRMLQRHPIPALKVAFKLDFYELVRTPELAHDLFLNPETEIDVVEFHKQLGRETIGALRLLFQLIKVNPHKTPVLVLSAGNDAFFTIEEGNKTAEKFGTKNIVIQGQAHDLMLESAWKEVADRIDQWIVRDLELP